MRASTTLPGVGVAGHGQHGPVTAHVDRPAAKPARSPLVPGFLHSVQWTTRPSLYHQLTRPLGVGLGHCDSTLPWCRSLQLKEKESWRPPSPYEYDVYSTIQAQDDKVNVDASFHAEERRPGFLFETVQGEFLEGETAAPYLPSLYYVLRRVTRWQIDVFMRQAPNFVSELVSRAWVLVEAKGSEIK